MICKNLIIFFLFIISNQLNAQTFIKTFYPKNANNCYVKEYSTFTVGFDTLNSIPQWTIYLLTKKESNTNTYPRTNLFIFDKTVKNCYKPSMFIGSGYDKGHMVPAEDQSYSQKGESECFYMTNMVAQLPCVNRGNWKEIENLVRSNVSKYDSLIVISGAIVDNLKLIKTIKVPDTFYKIIYSVKFNKLIIFVVDNDCTDVKNDIFTNVKSLEFLTSKTKIDFIFKNKFDNLDIDFWKK